MRKIELLFVEEIFPGIVVVVDIFSGKSGEKVRKRRDEDKENREREEGMNETISGFQLCFLTLLHTYLESAIFLFSPTVESG
jgi:uncharacterized protein (DUF1015 family)